SLTYSPAESATADFGENSNWRGPVWMPMTFLLIDTLRRYDKALGDGFTVECPVGSAAGLRLRRVANELARRAVSLCVPDASGKRPMLGALDLEDDFLPFPEFFDGDTGRGCGASHQGWTSLVARLIEDLE